MDQQDIAKVARLWSEPLTARPQHNSALFALYCVGSGLCATLDDFDEHFFVGLAYLRHLSRLVADGFLVELEGRYALTDLGQKALKGFRLTNLPQA